MKHQKTKQFSILSFIFRHWFELSILGFWLFFGAWFYVHAMQWRVDGWYFGHGNVWSDWSLHVSQVTRFVVTPPSEWWATSTYFSGGKYTYPFASNLLSALLIRIGWSYPAAMIGPSLVFWVATLATLWWFGRWILGSGKQAVVAISIFFCSAGLGLLRIFEAPSWLVEFMNPSMDYTQFTQYQWGTGNLFLGMFLPQRAFLMGFWIALLAWGLWLRSLESPWNKKTVLWIILAGFLAGLLPIVHMHSFMAVAFLSVPLAGRFLTQKWPHILLFAGVTALVSLPLYLLFVSGGIDNPEFFQVNLWWTTDTFGAWLVQWLWQWGVALPVAGYALWLLRGRLSSVRWWALASFWWVFLLANIVQFQPTAWDNTKLFLWVYWGVSLCWAWVLAELWRRGGDRKIAAILLTIVLTATGARELIRSADIEQYTYQATTVESYELAVQVRDQVPYSAVFATAPTHNHWVTMWAGRPIVMGYSAWVWNFGFLYQERESDLRLIFTSPSHREALLKKYQVSYIVVGPDEVFLYGISGQDFAEYPILSQTENTTVYDVRTGQKDN